MTILDSLGPADDAHFKQVVVDVYAAPGLVVLIVSTTTEERPGGDGAALPGQDERGG